jgi:hypothetical protein
VHHLVDDEITPVLDLVDLSDQVFDLLIVIE